MSTTSLQPYVINYVSEDNPANNQIFIKELYRNILDRSADQGGLTYWTSALNNHNVTRAELVKDFFDSPELQAKFQSSPEAAASVFHSLLNRDAKSTELNNLSNLISNGKSSVGEIAKEFLTSQEFLKLQNTSTKLPTVNVLWEDTPSWDSITANQLAKLIAYSPDGGVTHPNANLEFVVSGDGPYSKTPNAAPSHLPAPGQTLLNIVYPNTADGLSQFIKSISDQVFTLSGGQIKWGVSGGMGSISYHPDMNSAEWVADWSNWAPDGVTPNAQPYQTYVDYSLTLSEYLSSKGLQGFNRVIFESQSSGYTNNNLFGIDGSHAPAPPGTKPQDQLALLFNYNGNPALLKTYGITNWNDVFQAASTTGPVDNWNPAANGFASNSNLVQAYDLIVGEDYVPAWGGPAVLNPAYVSASQAASAFAQFFANTSDNNHIQALNNIKDSLTAAGSAGIGTSYNPKASIVFSYGNAEDQPVFQNAAYLGNTPQTTSDPNAPYRWSANDFANFLAGQSGFNAQLTQNLQKIATEQKVTGAFTNQSDLSIGVWGGERALDAWFGF